MPINLIRGETIFKMAYVGSAVSTVFEGILAAERFGCMQKHADTLYRLSRFSLVLGAIGFVHMLIYFGNNLATACCWGHGFVFFNIRFALLPLMFGLVLTLLSTWQRMLVHLDVSFWRVRLLYLLGLGIVVGGLIGPPALAGILLLVPMVATFGLILCATPAWSGRTAAQRLNPRVAIRACALFTLGFGALLSLRTSSVVLFAAATEDPYAFYYFLPLILHPLMAGLLVFAAATIIKARRPDGLGPSEQPQR